jgi:integrating conjugative element protein (TIGR03756 family)
MNEKTFLSRLRKHKKGLVAVALLGTYGPAYAVNTVQILASTISFDCIDYKIEGICFWLQCTLVACRVETSYKVRHNRPDAVVSAYQNTGDNPWTELRVLGTPIAGIAETGGDGAEDYDDKNEMSKFKNADVIGHPGQRVLNQFIELTYKNIDDDLIPCQAAVTEFKPYYLSTLDSLAWRQYIPEMVYPQALIPPGLPGSREVGSTLSGNSWGGVYPRGGFVHQADDYKAAAVIAQRAGDIVTRKTQPHVYLPMVEDDTPLLGYWPPKALKEGEKDTGQWQELTPNMSSSCRVFPNTASHDQATKGDYAWTLWRPYSCCQVRGVYITSVDFLPSNNRTSL